MYRSRALSKHRYEQKSEEWDKFDETYWELLHDHLQEQLRVNGFYGTSNVGPRDLAPQ